MRETSSLSSVLEELNKISTINRLGGVDTFFGRLYLFEDELGRRHIGKGLEWRKPGRYGNIVEFLPVQETIQFCLDQKWSLDELKELSQWYKSQNTPDTVVLNLIMEIEILKASKKEQKDGKNG